MNKLFNRVEQLEQLRGSLPTSGVVGLFFSAHWCSPCREFTPKLAETYKKIKEAADKPFEIVFISSDRDQEQFDSYFAEMPWLALPFEYRDLKAKLSKKFKANCIPSLILLDAKTGAIITADGRNALSKDPSGEKYPWVPPSPLEVLGSKFVTLSGESDGSAVKGKYVGIYFSAQWCWLCSLFTPRLIETYKKIKAERSDFEIVFCSADREEDQFKEYFGTMPWPALPFEDRDRALSLNKVCVLLSCALRSVQLLCLDRFSPY
jgi:nucleoredoxin